MQKTYHIYKLLQGDRTVYIGRTCDPRRRLRQHQKKMEKNLTGHINHKTGIYSLSDPNITMEIIHSGITSEYQAKLFECIYIAQAQLDGLPILNKQIDRVMLRRRS